MKKSELEQIIKEEVNKVLEQTGNRYGDDLMAQFAQHQKNVALKNRTAIGKGGAKIPFSSLSRGEQIAYDMLTDPKPSMMYDKPVIGFNVQPELRLAHNSFPTNKKPIPLEFKIAQSDMVVQTKEGPVRAVKGDAIMTGTKGENWPIPKDKFKQTYDVQPGGKTASKKLIKVNAVQMSKPFEVKVSWSPDTLKGKPGDFLVQYGPGDYGVVGKDIFKETYNTKAMPKSMTGPTRAKAAKMDADMAKAKKATTKGTKLQVRAPAKNFKTFASRLAKIGRAFPYLNRLFIAYGIREAAKRGFARGGLAGAATAIGAETLYLIPIVGEILMALEGQKIKSLKDAKAAVADADKVASGRMTTRQAAQNVVSRDFGIRKL